MPITITRLDKPFRVKCDDAWLHVSPRTEGQDNALRATHTKDGVFDEEAYLREKLDLCVTGWEGVVDQDGAVVPFQRGYVRGLPIQHQRRVLRCMDGNDDPLVDRWGTTSPPSSAKPSGTPPTEG